MTICVSLLDFLHFPKYFQSMMRKPGKSSSHDFFSQSTCNSTLSIVFCFCLLLLSNVPPKVTADSLEARLIELQQAARGESEMVERERLKEEVAKEVGTTFM